MGGRAAEPNLTPWQAAKRAWCAVLPGSGGRDGHQARKKSRVRNAQAIGGWVVVVVVVVVE